MCYDKAFQVHQSMMTTKTTRYDCEERTFCRALVKNMTKPGLCLASFLQILVQERQYAVIYR